MFMKKIFLAVLVGILLPVPVVWAHPPQTVVVTFDPETRIVNAAIVHPVNNADRHYIFRVDVAVNGQEILSQKITRQSDPIQEKVSYRIPDIKAGDTIQVDASCTISGKGTGVIAVK
jgi:hypothetical protein